MRFDRHQQGEANWATGVLSCSRGHRPSGAFRYCRFWVPWHSFSAFLLLFGWAPLAPHLAEAAQESAAEEATESKKPTSEGDISEGDTPKEGKDEEDGKKWQALFDGKSLKGWQVTDFAGHGKAIAEESQIVLQFGELLTGITWDEKAFEFRKSDYEISLQAQRVDGSDFFCCLTFPVGEEHCSLVVGGWGGTLVGISCIDGYDASENLTTTFEKFENKKWYPIRVRVTEEKIEAWIEDELLVEVERKGKEFSVRWEVEESRPLGVACYQSTAAIKDFKYRRLDEKE